MPELTTNFAVSTVATAPSPATSGTSLVVASGHGTRFPNPATSNFNCVVCPADAQPTPANAEIVRVTAKSTDTFTIARAQESSTARSIVVGDRIFAGVTAKTLADIETADNLISLTKRDNVNTVTTYMQVPLHERTTVNGNPFANFAPGMELAATGFSIADGGVIIPADAVANAMKVRMAVAAASGGNVRLSADVLKVADAGSITASASGGTAQTVTLSANTLKMVDIVTGVTATAGSYLNIRAYRNGDDGADTLAATAYLMAVVLVYDATI